MLRNRNKLELRGGGDGTNPAPRGGVTLIA